MKAIGIIFTFFMLVSCGIKGPPLPPQSDAILQKQKAESVTVNTTQASAKAASGDATDATKIEKRKQKR